jgi:hypothetical protein
LGSNFNTTAFGLVGSTPTPFSLILPLSKAMPSLRVLLFSLALAIVLVSAGAASAQKFAYLDSQYILELMPEYKSVQQELDNGAFKPKSKPWSAT